MAWFGLGKKEKEVEDDNDDIPIVICQGCGKKEHEAIEEGEPKFKLMQQRTSDGNYEFLFCRKCYRQMKKGKIPPLISQMQSQKKRR